VALHLQSNHSGHSSEYWLDRNSTQLARKQLGNYFKLKAAKMYPTAEVMTAYFDRQLKVSEKILKLFPILCLHECKAACAHLVMLFICLIVTSFSRNESIAQPAAITILSVAVFKQIVLGFVANREFHALSLDKICPDESPLKVKLSEVPRGRVKDARKLTRIISLVYIVLIPISVVIIFVVSAHESCAFTPLLHSHPMLKLFPCMYRYLMCAF
jgi:hypothetical protein